MVIVVLYNIVKHVFLYIDLKVRLKEDENLALQTEMESARQKHEVSFNLVLLIFLGRQFKHIK